MVKLLTLNLNSQKGWTFCHLTVQILTICFSSILLLLTAPGGLARRATFIDQQRKQYNNTLVIDGGNNFYGKILPTIEHLFKSSQYCTTFFIKSTVMFFFSFSGTLFYNIDTGPATLARWFSQFYDVMGIGSNDFFQGNLTVIFWHISTWCCCICTKFFCLFSMCS